MDILYPDNYYIAWKFDMIEHISTQKKQQALLAQHLESSVAHLLQYTNEGALEFNHKLCQIHPPKSLSFSKQLRDTGKHQVNKHFKKKNLKEEVKAQKNHARLAIKLIQRVITAFCHKVLQENDLEKQRSMHKILNGVKVPLAHLERYYTRINPKLSESFKEIAYNITYVDLNIKFVHQHIHDADENIIKLMTLNIEKIDTQMDLKKAIKIIQGGFLELYREAGTFYPIDMIKELLSSKCLRALENHQLNNFGHYLFDYIKENLTLFNQRPQLGDFEIPGRKRATVLNNHASMLTLKQKLQGGTVRDGYIFLQHKLRSFVALYGSDMDKGTLHIFYAFIENLSLENYTSIYSKLPSYTFSFKRDHFKNQQYFPHIPIDVKKQMITLAINFLNNALNSKYAQIGFYFPSGYVGHCAPFFIKLNKDNTFNILCANAGSGSVGKYTSISSTEHHFGKKSNFQEDDLGSPGVRIGEVITEFGPYTKDELINILAYALLLRKLIYLPYGFHDQDGKMAHLMKVNALKSLLDLNKQIEHPLLNQLDFQVIGNCFIKNPDLLIKDQLATHIRSLKLSGKPKRAAKSQRILNIYHEEFMVKKQDTTLKAIPLKRSIVIK